MPARLPAEAGCETCECIVLVLVLIARHAIFLWLKTGTLQKNEPYQINVVHILLSVWTFWIPVVEAPRKTKTMHFTKKQSNV